VAAEQVKVEDLAAGGTTVLVGYGSRVGGEGAARRHD
jgi:hypothetical protein